MKIANPIRVERRDPASHFELWLVVGLVGVAVYFLSGQFTSVRFDRERIEIWAAPGQLQVTGLYHYQNESRLPAVLTLSVPFPVDAEHGPPSTFSLSEVGPVGTPREIAPAIRGGRASFRLIFRPGEDKWVRLDYVQATRSQRGRYILTTTRAWRRSLERGQYVLHLRRGLTLSFSNYALDAAAPDEPRTYFFSRTNFYPDRDWEFSWDEPGTGALVARGGGP